MSVFALLPLLPLTLVPPSGVILFGARLPVSLSSARSHPCIRLAVEDATQAEIEALQAKLEILRLQARVAELQKAATGADAIAPPPVPPAPVPTPSNFESSPAQPPLEAPSVQPAMEAPSVQPAMEAAAVQPIEQLPQTGLEALLPPVETAAGVPADAAISGADVASQFELVLPTASTVSLPWYHDLVAAVSLPAVAALVLLLILSLPKLNELASDSLMQWSINDTPGARIEGGSPVSYDYMAAPAARTDRFAPPASAAGAAAAAGAVGRSAPEILFAGVGNLDREPLGWLFGAPSPLYSNVPVATPPRPAVAGVALGMPVPAPATLAGASGRVVPNIGKKGKKGGRVQQATGAARVAPSTPEELDLARKGLWSYGADERE